MGTNIVMESHGNGQKIVMAIENILEKSRKRHGISLLLITNHAREVPIIPYV